MAVEFARVNATDQLQRSARFRLTYQKSRLLGWTAPSMAEIWDALPSLNPGAITVSPAPADGPVGVIDVKAPASAPSMSVGRYADSLDRFPSTDLVRLEAIDATALSQSQAGDDRAKEVARASTARAEASPFNVFGNLTRSVRLAAIAAIIVTAGVLAIRFIPKQKRRR